MKLLVTIVLSVAVFSVLGSRKLSEERTAKLVLRPNLDSYPECGIEVFGIPYIYVSEDYDTLVVLHVCPEVYEQQLRLIEGSKYLLNLDVWDGDSSIAVTPSRWNIQYRLVSIKNE